MGVLEKSRSVMESHGILFSDFCGNRRQSKRVRGRDTQTNRERDRETERQRDRERERGGGEDCGMGLVAFCLHTVVMPCGKQVQLQSELT